jgi:hypothetical protein
MAAGLVITWTGAAPVQADSPAEPTASVPLNASVLDTFDPNGPNDNDGCPKDIPTATGADPSVTPGPSVPKGTPANTDRAAVQATFVTDGTHDNPPAGGPADPGQGGDAPESPPPGNDYCSGAIDIPGDALSFNPPLLDTTGATTDVCVFNNCGGNSNSVWYYFSPVWPGTISINTNGSNYDTVVVIFDDCAYLDPQTGCYSPNSLVCDDDSGLGTASQITAFLVTPGTSYHIMASSSPAGGGMLDFNFMYSPTPPANDDCENATTITGLSYDPAPYFVGGASDLVCDAQESCAASATHFSVWYRYTPQYDGMANIDTIGSNYDTVLSVFDSCRGFDAQLNCNPAPVELACNDDIGGFFPYVLQSHLIDVPMQAGSTYMIKVAAFGSSAPGMLNFNFSYTAPPPPNDDCGSPMPVVLTGAPVGTFNPPLLLTIGADEIFAEPDEPCVNMGVSNTVFYSFIPPCNGLMSINTNGSNYDTVLSVWHSDCGYYAPPAYANPPFVACDDDSGTGLASQLVDIPVNAGLYYIIKVADYNTAPGGGWLDFNLTFVGTGLGNIVSANPPKYNPYLPLIPQPFRDVLQNRDITNTTDQGIGAVGTPNSGAIGYSVITVTFTQATCPLMASMVNVACTDVSGNGSADCPSVVSVAGDGGVAFSMALSGAIPERECTTLTFLGTNAGQKLQYQFLPGDVDLNGTANTQDVLALVTAVNNGSANQSTNLARYNIDRTGAVNTQDFLREVQLLNGTNTTQVFNGATVAPCP